MDEAVYPLTLHDNMFAGIVIVVGWLVEGSVDILRFERALDAVTAKWKLLNGRIEKVDVRVSNLKTHTHVLLLTVASRRCINSEFASTTPFQKTNASL